MDLTGWRLADSSSDDGNESEQWSYLELTGVIRANGYYLVRCGATGGTNYEVPTGNQEWDILLHNKGLSVALLDERAEDLTDAFTGAVTEENRPEGYVDLLAVQGNDAEDSQIPPAYEGAYEDLQSKKKAVRRDNFADTDNNADDASEVNYEDPVDAELGPHGPGESGEGTTDPGTGDEGGTDTPSQTYWNDSFNGEASLQLSRTGDAALGTANADGGVAAIVSYNPDNGKAYVVNGQAGVLNVVTVNADGSLTTEESIQVPDLSYGFTYGDLTNRAAATGDGQVVSAR